jgi:hypothetical protein
MAEKKFFVDINLQGSALTNAKIGTNSAIGSTEGAFGYDSASHRLQYFNGSTTENVANLADIAAVTGGLIFQGGYDPTTNTPDITDGTAFKGFFWAATAAGTFLGESVQVGDSIVAKVDAAGATLADWLILQGNIVIATDSVDGISRLATQTEANDGTEAGAVVITPATLQGKIDAQITPEINSKVSKSGDTMSGDLNMGGHNIGGVNTITVNTSLYSPDTTQFIISTESGKILIPNSNLDLNSNGKVINLPAPTNGGDAANKTYVDDNTSNKLPLAGGTMSGTLAMNGNGLTGAVISNSELGTDLNAYNYRITYLSAPTDSGDAANKIYVDDADALKLDLAGGTMTGNINMSGNEVTGASAVRTGNLYSSSTGDSIYVQENLDFENEKSIINLPAPTADGDAANKLYVDTTVAAQSFTATIATGDWTALGDQYEAGISHNLGTMFLSVTTLHGNETADFLVETALNGNISTIYSNFVPANDVHVSLIKANGNL